MDAFYILAEVALGIAGFGSIAIVLGHRGSGWLAGDYFRTSALFVSSLGALLQALLVIGFNASGMEPETVWRASSGTILAHYAIAGVFLRWWRQRHLERSMWFGAGLIATVWPSAGIVMAWLIANLLGLGVMPGPSAPYFAIVWLLAFACLMLIRIVFVRHDGDA